METTSTSKPCCTWRPTTAGILTIIAGALNVIAGIVVLTWGSLGMMRAWSWYMFDEHPRFQVIVGIGIVLLVIGIVSIIGGIFSLRSRLWGLALAGAILALFPPPVFVLGLLSIIFLALSKGEFDQSSPVSGQPPPA